jgi:predicted dehydrogenase
MHDPARKVRPLNVGIIGLGYWGPNLLRVLADDTDVEVAWMCDRDPERLARFHRRYPAARTTGRAERVLDDPQIDAVVIATPVCTHFELGMASLVAGKHTFIEKPLAASTQMADELIDTAGRVDRVLMCGHTFLYSPPVRAVARMLDGGVLGQLYFASSSRVNLGPYRGDVSVVWDLGPHDFSILRYWLGQTPSIIRATGRDALASGIADIAFVTMTFPGGMVANVELSWLAPSKLRRTVLVGSEKMVVYDDAASEPIRLFDRGIVLGEPESFGQYHLSYRSGDVISPRMEVCEPLVAELADFTRAVRRGDPLAWHAALSRDVVQMTQAAEQSLKAGGAAVVIADGSVAEADLPSPLPSRASSMAVQEPAA